MQSSALLYRSARVAGTPPLLGKRQYAGKEAKLPHTASLHKENPRVIATHVPVKWFSSILLMTCQVRVTSPDAHTTKATQLLDSASSASFITQRLAQHLRLPQRHHGMKIGSIRGVTTQSRSRGMVNLM